MTKKILNLSCFLLLATSLGTAEDSLFERAPWSYSLGIGEINFEGDQVVEDSPFITLRAMKNLDERWGYEFILDLLPQVEGSSGENPERRRLGGNIGTEPDVADTWGFRLAMDGNYHLRNIENLRWDPYLSLGVGITYFDESFSGSNGLQVYGGGGLMYHFDDSWAIRADLQGLIAGSHTEFNAMYSIGINYRPVPDRFEAFRVTGTVQQVVKIVDDEEKIYEFNIGADLPNELIIEFDTDQDTIRSADYHQLEALIEVIGRLPASTMVVEGHADQRPTSLREYNLDLSQRRANRVRQYLLSNSPGMDPARITAKGYGFDRPLVPNTSEENMQRNRRVEIYIDPNLP